MSYRQQNFRVNASNDVWLFKPIRMYRGRRRRRGAGRRARFMLAPPPMKTQGISGKQILGAVLALPVLSAGIWVLGLLEEMFRGVYDFIAGCSIWTVFGAFAVLAVVIIGSAMLRR